MACRPLASQSRIAFLVRKMKQQYEYSVADLESVICDFNISLKNHVVTLDGRD
jgi:hypothetical protein